MALMLLIPDDPAELWRDELRARMPELEVRLWPEVGDPAEIEVACSTAFGCSIDGAIPVERVVRIAVGLAEAGGRVGGGVLATGSVTMAADVRLLLGLA